LASFSSEAGKGRRDFQSAKGNGFHWKFALLNLSLNLRFCDMPKVLLINAIDKSLVLAEQPPFPFPVLNIITVAALFPPEWEIEVIDEAIEAVNLDTEADLVGISTLTLDATHAYELADHFRNRNMPVLVGGMHPTAMPEEALQHADSVVIGEAEEIFDRVLSDFKAGRMRGTYRSERLPDLNQLPRPRYDLLRPKHRSILHSVQATRGCPHDCEFCSVTPFFGHQYRLKPVKEVIADLETSFREARSRTVFFVDDNIGGRAEYAKELFRALIPLKIKWGSFASVAMTRDREIMTLASESGCIALFIGFESLSQTNLDALHKSWVRADQMREYVSYFMIMASLWKGHSSLAMMEIIKISFAKPSISSRRPGFRFRSLASSHPIQRQS
jgi:radical SAM superfamily enzyme YgiQ (UPF0313 family)